MVKHFQIVHPPHKKLKENLTKVKQTIYFFEHIVVYKINLINSIMKDAEKGEKR